MGNKPLKVNVNHDLQELDKRFERKRNILYAVLDIGKNPNRPSKWAIEACKEYKDWYSKNHLDLAKLYKVYIPKKHNQKVYLETKSKDDLLDAMALILSREPSIGRRQAAVKVIGDKNDINPIRDLTNKWDREWPKDKSVLDCPRVKKFIKQ
jgi:hypothetical protein